ncbi:ATPase domain-containing protein [Arhodomonas sp. SL1]|uniref:ATPase domain-containing protein n=1 Tax=Arhodomonas sp. SL1 TaxID=3425691 RepID=UPI003F8846D2
MHSEGLVKRATGIPGLDAVAGGGLPRDGATLILGAAGSGKTVLGLQLLAAGIARGEGGILLSFEESAAQLRRDAGSFSWGPELLASQRLALIDGTGLRGSEVAGRFDLEGLLAGLDAAGQRSGAGWVMLDGVDQLLRRQPDPDAALEELARVVQWCERDGRSLLLTGKLAADRPAVPVHLEGLEFLVPAVVVLSAELAERRLNRRFRIAKYRGTAHVTDELAMVMDDEGIHLPYSRSPELAEMGEASTARVGIGVSKLDRILGGGVYRGSTTLISGQPGTAKTTLCAAFAAAAAARGERVLFFSFDEMAGQIARNSASVGIDLRGPMDTGQLRMRARTAWLDLLEGHYMALMAEIEDFQPDCLVVDPVSALLKAAGSDSPFLAIERIVTHTRTAAITTVMTSLSESDDPVTEDSMSHTSTLADTWLVLRYAVQGGERNRALSVVKSRGTAHSNQVREMLLSEQGIDFVDVYPFGDSVLMGTARLQKRSEAEARARREAEMRARRRREREQEMALARSRMEQARLEYERLRAELRSDEAEERVTDDDTERHRRDVVQRRGGGMGAGEGE